MKYMDALALSFTAANRLRRRGWQFPEGAEQRVALIAERYPIGRADHDAITNEFMAMRCCFAEAEK